MLQPPVSHSWENLAGCDLLKFFELGIFIVSLKIEAIPCFGLETRFGL